MTLSDPAPHDVLLAFITRYARRPLTLSTTEPETEIVRLTDQPVTAEALGPLIRLHLTPTASLNVTAADIDSASAHGDLLEFTVNGTAFILATH